jgi:hypothetical protein
MKKVKYKKGYKYQLVEDCICQTAITGFDIDTQFIKLSPDGTLTVKSGYAWDGASGPTIDTHDTIRGSLFHDSLYQLMRRKLLPGKYRNIADILLKDICIEDGMHEFRAEYWYIGVSRFAHSQADPKKARQIYTAP